MTTTTNGDHSGIRIKYDETSAEVQIRDVLVRPLWNDENRPGAEPQAEISYLHDKTQFWKNSEKIIELEAENKELKKDLKYYKVELSNAKSRLESALSICNSLTSKNAELQVENKELKKVNAESFDHYCLQSEKIAGLKAKYDIAIEALKEVTLGRGAYNKDHLKHATNCIEAMKNVAAETLARIGIE